MSVPTAHTPLQTDKIPFVGAHHIPKVLEMKPKTGMSLSFESLWPIWASD